MRILGIDPGTAICGWSILDYMGNKFSLVDYGVVRTPAGQELEKRLLTIYQELKALMDRYSPDAMAVEELFFNTNVKTAITVGQARGVIVLLAAQMGIGFYEYTPLQVKQAVVGYGRADKTQVQQMIKTFLNLEVIPKPDDAADALAVALCHLNSFKLGRIIEREF